MCDADHAADARTSLPLALVMLEKALEALERLDAGLAYADGASKIISLHIQTREALAELERIAKGEEK